MTRWTTPSYIQVLNDSLEPYKKASGKQRAFIVQEVKEKICNLARNDHASPPDDLGQVYMLHSIFFCGLTHFLFRKFGIGCTTTEGLPAKTMALIQITTAS
jgi:hypothetical protein